MQVTERKQPVGSLKISRDVIAAIAANAAKEVDGVQGIAPFAVNLRGILSKRQLARPVSIHLVDDIAEIDVQLILREGAQIPVVSEKVQEAVKESIQNMTGITVSRVNILIAGVAFASQEHLGSEKA